MCCFTRNVESVTDTRIFARDSRAMMQFLVYEMKFSANEDLAMILPLPVPKRTAEKAVRFINLDKYPNFFSQMESGFAPDRGGAAGGFGGGAMGGSPLKVVDVGSFEASFVPAINDFSRLDERFRLSPGAWEQLPQYKNFGFAVFKLKKGQIKIHPMAFEFPRVDRTQLFFPTVHIHDGKVHSEAEFDHTLYAQFRIEHQISMLDWTESRQPAGMFMSIKMCEGLVSKLNHVYKHVIKGKHKNEDVVA